MNLQQLIDYHAGQSFDDLSECDQIQLAVAYQRSLPPIHAHEWLTDSSYSNSVMAALLDAIDRPSDYRRFDAVATAQIALVDWHREAIDELLRSASREESWYAAEQRDDWRRERLANVER